MITQSNADKILVVIKLTLYAFFAWLNMEMHMQVFTILIIFMSIDSVLGAIKSVRLGKKFSFNKLIWGFCLKLCFLIIPLLIALLGKGLNYDLGISVNIVMKILIVSEAYSVFGNIYAAKNKVEVERLDVISMLLKSIRTGLRKILNKGLKQIEQDTNQTKDLDELIEEDERQIKINNKK